MAVIRGAYRKPSNRRKVEFKHYLPEDLYNAVEAFRGSMPRSKAIELLVEAGLKVQQKGIEIG
jgi:hypothetical protein